MHALPGSLTVLVLVAVRVLVPAPARRCKCWHQGVVVVTGRLVQAGLAQHTSGLLDVGNGGCMLHPRIGQQEERSNVKWTYLVVR